MLVCMKMPCGQPSISWWDKVSHRSQKESTWASGCCDPPPSWLPDLNRELGSYRPLEHQCFFPRQAEQGPTLRITHLPVPQLQLPEVPRQLSPCLQLRGVAGAGEPPAQQLHHRATISTSGVGNPMRNCSLPSGVSEVLELPGSVPEGRGTVPGHRRPQACEQALHPRGNAANHAAHCTLHRIQLCSHASAPAQKWCKTERVRCWT